jgi:hypothetical protein
MVVEMVSQVPGFIEMRMSSFFPGQKTKLTNTCPVAWRLPYGESGILDFFLARLAEGNLRQKLHIHALRLIGNSCADTDENRARVVENDGLLAITKHVNDEGIIPFNIPVIYNILVDYGEYFTKIVSSASRLTINSSRSCTNTGF